jgi:hypothetical protein
MKVSELSGVAEKIRLQALTEVLNECRRRKTRYYTTANETLDALRKRDLEFCGGALGALEKFILALASNKCQEDMAIGAVLELEQENKLLREQANMNADFIRQYQSEVASLKKRLAEMETKFAK